MTADQRQQFLQNTPGYQFALQQGVQNTTNAASAAGLLNSGNTLQGLARFTTGLADQTYQQQIGNYLNLAQVGQAAAAGQAANVGNAAANIGNTLVNQGNTMAGIDVNTAAGITKSIGNAANQYQTLQGLDTAGAGSAGPTDPLYGGGAVAGGFTPTMYGQPSFDPSSIYSTIPP